MSGEQMRVTRQACGCVLIECPCGAGLNAHLDALGLQHRDLLCDEHQGALDRGEKVPVVFKRQIPRRRSRRRR